MIYLASPYSHPDVNVRIKRYYAAVDKIAHLARQGVHAYSPIVHWHPVASIHDDLPTDHLFWQANNRMHIIRSSALWVLTIDGYEESQGIADEIQYAQSLGIPVVYTQAEVSVDVN